MERELVIIWQRLCCTKSCAVQVPTQCDLLACEDGSVPMRSWAPEYTTWQAMSSAHMQALLIPPPPTPPLFARAGSDTHLS